MPRAVDVLSQCALNPAGDNKMRREITGFIDGLGKVAGILSYIQDHSYTLLDIRNLFAELWDARDRDTEHQVD